MSRKLIIFIVIAFWGPLNAQEYEPLELVQKVFTDKNFAKRTNKYFTGEYKGHPNANDLSKNTKLSFRLLDISENTAVVNVTIFNNLGSGIDTYAHLKKDKVWKIEAFRALAMTGFMQRILLEMEKLSDEQIDTAILQDKSTFKSKADFYQELEHIKLTLALDDTIIEHFVQNKEQFVELKEELLKTKFDKVEQSYRKINLGEHIKTDYKKLLIRTISNSFNCENCFEFVIGGMTDNTVGYLYIPNTENVPKMNATRIIMIKEIGNGWYLFKTT